MAQLAMLLFFRQNGLVKKHHLIVLFYHEVVATAPHNLCFVLEHSSSPGCSLRGLNL